jgi:hypothetical protein
MLPVPQLPEALRARPAEPPPQVPVLTGGLRRRPRRRSIGPAVWLGLLAVAAVAVAAVLITDPFADHEQAATAPATAPLRRPPPRPPADQWGPLHAAKLPALPVAVSQAAAVPLGGRILLVADGSVLAGPASGRLRHLAALPSRRAAAAFFSDGHVWIVGGERAGKPTDEILRVDPRTRRVTRSLPFEEPLAEAGYVGKDGSLYLAGGWTGDKYATAILRFSPPDQVALVARLPVGVRRPAVALVGKRLYVAGGLAASGPTRTLLSVDLETGTLRRLGRLPQALSGALLVPAGSALYLLGGVGAGGVPASAVVRIDPAGGRAEIVGESSVPLGGATSLSSGKNAFVFTGRAAYRFGP